MKGKLFYLNTHTEGKQDIIIPNIHSQQIFSQLALSDDGFF